HDHFSSDTWPLFPAASHCSVAQAPQRQGDRRARPALGLDDRRMGGRPGVGAVSDGPPRRARCNAKLTRPARPPVLRVPAKRTPPSRPRAFITGVVTLRVGAAPLARRQCAGGTTASVPSPL